MLDNQAQTLFVLHICISTSLRTQYQPPKSKREKLLNTTHLSLQYTISSRLLSVGIIVLYPSFDNSHSFKMNILSSSSCERTSIVSNTTYNFSKR